jgi:crotonobetainyl-CoA hydratase
MFGLSEVKRGLYAAAGGAFRMAQQIPLKQAMEILLTGDPITAQRALDLGLINRVVPAAQLLETALELAHKIASNAPLSVQASKRIAMGIAEGRITREEQFWEINSHEGIAVMHSKDAREGPRAFAEKRDPVWQAK